ncbi:VPS10 domain-containing protein [Hydrotalea flava]|uniref:VPS10 domain-containing protein n=1 Tax=Hydrotalea flava TaxID=714549 RepID=UPI0020A5EBD9|nr:hypothetical protein [Hydrotalea flava]
MKWRFRFLMVVLLCTIIQTLQAQVSAALFQEMQWRMIGPHRGGRTVGAVGVPQQPNVFYIGVNNGGVWKTTDYGRTWFPIFDDQPTGSIGDVAVAPSNPDIIYVGSGEGLQRPDLSVGNGMYKSTNAGKKWQHLGLTDVQQIGAVAIDPTNPNRVFVAAMGHPYCPNAERGVFRTLDGGKTWEKVLYKDENTGAVQVSIDPKNPNIIFADLWAGRQGPWENGEWNGSQSGLFKSVDGGNTWTKITRGLPTVKQGLGRIGFCIAPSNPKRMYATVDAGEYGGMYRSDDAGESWYSISNDGRYWGRGSDFAEVKADPQNEDIVYTANVVVWRSEDGGHSWKDFRGAPGGDDYHRIWINPNNSDIILIAADQGAIITVNGGETFSSWYNQPTAQFYHVSTDNAFPYNVYGGQQESGSVGIASRGNDGQITFREWHPVGVEEYGYVAADPLNPNIIYGGKITKYDKRTGQVQNIAPEAVRTGKYRFIRTVPVLFSPVNPHTLYFAGNVLFKTNNGGMSWQVISPDLTRNEWDIPASVGIYTTPALKTMPRRGVIYTIAPSYTDSNTIWCGTDDGYIQITRDGGKSWKNITPAAIISWSKISLMDCGHFDNNTVYAAVNRIRCDDLHPHIYVTHNGGNTWEEKVNGLPDNEPINVVREDPKVNGLLFAGSENAVYVSFDNGNHWQSLRLNMPATSIRDLVIKDDDIVVGTHGRSFWILDNITPLRQIAQQRLTVNKAYLFQPQNALRIRWDMNTDTPLPQEEPAGKNPPDGAIIDYYLPANYSGTVMLSIKDATGNIIRSYASTDTPYAIPKVNIPKYWIRPQQILSAQPGMHRFLWDMHLAPLPVPPAYPIAAIYGNTAPLATAPWVLPGIYTAILQVNGKTVQQTFKVVMDPMVTTTSADLQRQFNLANQCYEISKTCLERLQIIQQMIQNTESASKINSLNTIAGNASNGRRVISNKNSYHDILQQSRNLMSMLEEADMPPTHTIDLAVQQLAANFKSLENQWQIIISE